MKKGLFWNGWGDSQSNLLFIVCGSATTWMTNKLLGDKGGLHNRVTRKIYLAPFNLYDTERMLQSVGIKASKDPFLVFKYKGVKTTKEKLDDDEMQRIINLELPEDSLIWHCNNYFLFSYYCAGIRAADLIQLRWRNVTASGRLHYQMGKNHKERDLLLVEPALDILRHYHNEDVKPDDYILAQAVIPVHMLKRAVVKC